MGVRMRNGILALAVVLAACGQGQGGGVGIATPRDGWQLTEATDQLTGASSHSATRVVQMEGGQIELTATCPEREQLLFAYDEWGEAEAVGMAKAVEFRLTFLANDPTQTFAIGSPGTAMGIENSFGVRASLRDGHEERMVAFVDHVNSVNIPVVAAGLIQANPTFFRVEVPLLVRTANAGTPPTAQSQVVDLMPQDEVLAGLIRACDPNATPGTQPVTATAPQAAPAAFTLASVPSDAVADPGCAATDEAGVAVFRNSGPVGLISLNGSLIQVIGTSEDGSGELVDGTGRVRASIARTAEPVETEHEVFAGPATLTVAVDGAGQTTQVTYTCGS